MKLCAERVVLFFVTYFVCFVPTHVNQAQAAGSYNYALQGTDWNTTADNEWKCLAVEGVGGAVQTSTRQSPVDVDTRTVATLPSDVVTISSNGGYRRFQVRQVLQDSITIWPDGFADTIRVQNNTYVLSHYKIHAPSEHLIDGTQYGLEVQITFQQGVSPSNLVVMSHLYRPVDVVNSVFFDIGLFNALLIEADLTAAEPRVYNTTDTRYDYMDQAIVAGFTVGAPFYQYYGSATQPPCDENVFWLVAGKAIPIPNLVMSTVAGKLAYDGTKGNYRAVTQVLATNHQSSVAMLKYSGTEGSLVYAAMGAAHYCSVCAGGGAMFVFLYSASLLLWTFTFL